MESISQADKLFESIRADLHKLAEQFQFGSYCPPDKRYKPIYKSPKKSKAPDSAGTVRDRKKDGSDA